jgi:hypothetical protein
MKTFVTAFAVAAAALVAVPASALTIGTPNGGNCFPFGCGSGTRYQQVWVGSAFGGPITLTNVGFEVDFGSTVNGGTYTISFSTTERAVNTIDDFPFDSNVGADDTVVYTGTLAPQFDGTWLVFDGFSFDYDPAEGNLLMDVKISDIVGSSIFFKATNFGDATEFSRAHDFGTGTDGWGLVATFNGDFGGVIPEPATWAMMIAGFGLVGAAARRRRAAATA